MLAFDDAEIKSLFNVLAALVHLGRAGAISCPGAASSGQRLGQFKSANEAHIAASLLGVSFNQLNDFVFTLLNATSSTQNGIFYVL